MFRSTTSIRRRTMLLLGLAYAAIISLGLPDGLTGVAWPSIRTTFSLPLDALGALITIATIGSLVSSITSGRIVSSIGVGSLLVLGSLAIAMSLLGYAFAPLWSVMVGLGLLAGLGAGAIDAGLNTYAAENFSPRIVNWLHASFGLGSAIGPIVMSSIVSAGQSWRLGYLIVGVAQLLLASCFALSRRQWQPSGDGTQATLRARAPMAHTFVLPSAWLSILLFFLSTGLALCAGQWLYTLLTEARGMLPALAGVWVSVYWGSLTFGRLLSGVIVARISVRMLLQLCMLGAIGGTVLLWFNLAATLSLAGVALLGLSLAPIFPSLISLTPARMGPAHSANTVGFQIAAARLGGAALVSGFGVIADQFGLEKLGPILLIVAVLMSVVFEVLERQTSKSEVTS